MEEITLARLCDEIRTGAIIWSRHFTQRSFERNQPSSRDVRFVICEDEPVIMERYADRPAMLIWGMIESGRRAHVQCSSPPNAVVVTAYWPDTQPEEWDNDFRVRR